MLGQIHQWIPGGEQGRVPWHRQILYPEDLQFWPLKQQDRPRRVTHQTSGHPGVKSLNKHDWGLSFLPNLHYLISEALLSTGLSCAYYNHNTYRNFHTHCTKQPQIWERKSWLPWNRWQNECSCWSINQRFFRILPQPCTWKCCHLCSTTSLWGESR